jgi:hypothetical protein
LVLSGYLLLGLATVGRFALGHMASVCACTADGDTAIFTWSLAWWPHALLHGLNPLVTHAVWAPTGTNIARDTTIPVAALAMWPVTAAFGPLASYNVLAIASPVLTAFTTYLLCRRITGRQLPAVAAGYLFGFGPYMFVQLVVHLNLTMVFLVPVMIHLALRRAEREISAKAYVGAMAAVLVLQMGLSTEVLCTAVLLGAVMLLAALVLAPVPRRAAIWSVIAGTAAAVGVAGVITAPFLYYALIRGGAPQAFGQISNALGLDLLNPVFPTRATLIGGRAFELVANTFEDGNVSESGGYLALPVVIVFCGWVAAERRRFLARMLALAAAVSFVGALGSHLHVAGLETVALPFALVRRMPVIDLLAPSRLVMYTALALAIGMAAWLAAGQTGTRGALLRWSVFAVAAAMVLPNIGSGLWGEAPSNPRFFRSALYRRHLRPGESVLVLPYAAQDLSMLWQAETGFYFRMPEGYLSNEVPKPWVGEPIVHELESGKPVNPAALAGFLETNEVGAVIVDDSPDLHNSYAGQLAALGLRGESTGGVTIFNLHAGRLQTRRADNGPG